MVENRERELSPTSWRSTRARRRGRLLASWAAITSALIVLLALIGLISGRRIVSTAARLHSGPAPAFTATDLVSRRLVGSRDFRKGNTLLFFSEGVMCQACFEQIQSLESVRRQLAARRLSLISITTDTPDVLRQAVAAYELRTPMISDADRRISNAYEALGLGMHPDTDGHTFILVDRHGVIRWRRDYTTMYVPPRQLLRDIPEPGP